MEATQPLFQRHDSADALITNLVTRVAKADGQISGTFSPLPIDMLPTRAIMALEISTALASAEYDAEELRESVDPTSMIALYFTTFKDTEALVRAQGPQLSKSEPAEPAN